MIAVVHDAADLSILFVLVALACGIAAAFAAWRGAVVPALVLVGIAVALLIFGA